MRGPYPDRLRRTRAANRVDAEPGIPGSRQTTASACETGALSAQPTDPGAPT